MDQVISETAPTQEAAPAQNTEAGSEPQYVTKEAFDAFADKVANDSRAQFGRVFQALEKVTAPKAESPAADPKTAQDDPFAADREALQAQAKQLAAQKAAMTTREVRQGIIEHLRGKGVKAELLPNAVDSIMLRHGEQFEVVDNGLGESKIMHKQGELYDAHPLDAFGNEYLSANPYLLPDRQAGNIQDGDNAGVSKTEKVSASAFAQLSIEDMQSGRYEIDPNLV